MIKALDHWHQFFADFYDAVTRPDPWGEVAASVANLVGRSRVAVSLVERETGKPLGIGGVGRSDESARLYHELRAKDIVTSSAMQIESSRPVSQEQIVPRSELQRSEFYNEFQRRVGIEDLSAIAIDEGRVRLLIYLFHHNDEPPMAPTEALWLSHLVPHFQTALRLRRSTLGPEAGRFPWTSAQLQHTFGLTSSEARVALMLSSGMPTKDIARDLLLEPSSVRSHLKAVFAKTDTHSQVELVHTLLSNLPPS